MKTSSIGIGDISIHIPEPEIQLSTLVEQRLQENATLERHLSRALRTTGQVAMRFPRPWEDTATMAAEAVRGLVRRASNAALQSLRHLSVGTETGVDHSKPVSSYVQGMLQGDGLAFPSSLSSVQVQHACAGGTMAMLGVAGLLAAGGRKAESGIVACSDIARYQLKSTAEITQGAGAAALLLEESPRLIELDLASVGYHSRDVDDFFRPLGSSTAEVNGSYSMRCYAESLEAAFLDHCGRSGELPHDVLRQTDLLVLHTPFHNMPGMALRKLLESQLGLGDEQAARFLSDRAFHEGIDPLARIGNLYTASMYTALAFLLDARYRAVGEGIVGKRILFASYGSGSTMIVFSGHVAAGAPSVVSQWDLGRIHASAAPASFEEYAAWAQGPDAAREYARRQGQAAPAGAFTLAGIRRDGYRQYARAEAPRAGMRDDTPLVDAPLAAAAFA